MGFVEPESKKAQCEMPAYLPKIHILLQIWGEILALLFSNGSIQKILLIILPHAVIHVYN